MSKGTISNRVSFLSSISSRLGRNDRLESVQRPNWKFQPQHRVLKDHSQDQLLEILKDQCTRIHTDIVETTVPSLTHTISQVVDNYGGGPIVTWADKRLESYGLHSLFSSDWKNMGIDVHVWDSSKGDENRKFAEEANIGITFSDVTLAESGTVVLFSNSDRGRSVSLLPTNYIALIPKSSIVPRMTQFAASIHQTIENGEPIPPCINFITGPSNSADIEMKLVVGVHGPIRATYIILLDQ
jgi:L-lactate dehydrogenase complex protein LldG